VLPPAQDRLHEQRQAGAREVQARGRGLADGREVRGAQAADREPRRRGPLRVHADADPDRCGRVMPATRDSRGMPSAIPRSSPRAAQGSMARAREEVVGESSRARIARGLELGPRIRLGPGERKSGGPRRDSILSDAPEPVVGAIYLDAGFERCREVVLPWFEPLVAALPAGGIGKDPKTRLQEWLQARQRPLPAYELVSESGEEHARVFLVRCSLAEPALEAEGSGSSRRAAEQQAATAILEHLEPRTP